MSPPLISDYKKTFVFKRVIQTLLGGPRLFSPPTFIIIQITLFTIPAVIVSLVNLDKKDLGLKWKSILTGCSVFLVDLSLSLIILLLKRDNSLVTPIISIHAPPTSNEGSNLDSGDSESGTRVNRAQESSFLAEEDVIESEGCLKASTWNFIAPNVTISLMYISAVTLSSISFGLCTPLMISETVSPILRGFCIIALCIARYSSVICSPPEVATFDATDRKHLLYRSFYTAFLGFSYVFLIQISEELETSVAVLLSFCLACAFLPILWVTGTLPPLDALFPWILETMLQITAGSSPAYFYFGTVISLIVVILCPIVVFIISQESLLIILTECVCGYIISCDIGRAVSVKAVVCEETPTKSFLRQLLYPILIISTSLVCVLVTWLNLSRVSTFEYEMSFAIVTLVITISLWIFRHFTIARKTSQEKITLLPLYILHGLLTFLLHIWLTLSIEHEKSEWSSIRTSVSHRIVRLVPYLLTIRAFALSISEPRKSTIDFTITFIIREYLGESKSSFVLILLISSLITSRFKRFLKHLKTVCSVWYAIGVSNIVESKFCVSVTALAFLPVSLWSLIIASIVEGSTLTPIFTLPIFILGFPRPSSFWLAGWFRKSKNNKKRDLNVETTDWKIYSEIGPLLACGLSRTAYKAKLKLEQGECFLARYEDRLLFIRIVSSGWNFAYLQIIGLEMQEQTSCHHQEALKIDETFEKTFGSSKSNLLSTCVNPLSLPILMPSFLLNIPTYSEAKSNISSLCSSQEKATFRDMFYRSFSYLWIKNNPALKGESYQREINRKFIHNQSLRFTNPNNGIDAIPAIDTVEKNSITDLQPYSMNNALFKCTLSTVNFIQSDQLVSDVVSLEPVDLPNGVSDEFVNPYLNEEETSEPKILSRPSTRSTLVSPTENNRVMIQTIESFGEMDGAKEFPSSDKLSSIWIKQCVGHAIPSNAVKARVEKICRAVWDTIIGTDDEKDIDMAEFFHENFQSKLKSLSTSRKVDMEEITLKAFRYSSKLTLDEIFSSANFASNNSKDIILDAESEEEIFSQLTLYEREFQFCCPEEIPMWIQQNTNHIITIARNGNVEQFQRNQQGSHAVMRIFHYEPSGVEFRIGQLDQFTVEGIWSNLNLELLYFTSDDDERFSIQNDKILLRNIVTQCAKAPLGYPVYDAVFRINLHNFSTTQME